MSLPTHYTPLHFGSRSRVHMCSNDRNHKSCAHGSTVNRLFCSDHEGPKRQMTCEAQPIHLFYYHFSSHKLETFTRMSFHSRQCRQCVCRWQKYFWQKKNWIEKTKKRQLTISDTSHMSATPRNKKKKIFSDLILFARNRWNVKIINCLRAPQNECPTPDHLLCDTRRSSHLNTFE